jgi:putative ABC transport system substrate-binding protein
MKRRQFLGALGSAMAWPYVGQTQEASRTYRLGFLVPAGRDVPATVAFFDELRLNGFVEGQNFTVVPGGFGVSNEQIAEGVATLVDAHPDVIVAGPELYVRALSKAIKTTPLVSMSEDLVGEGFATSLARPGGNVTGISLLSPELDGKRQGLLIEAVPNARKMAALVDSTLTAPHHLPALRSASQARGVELLFAAVSKLDEIAGALDDAKARGAEAVNVLATPLFFVNRRFIIDHIAGLRLPAIYQWPDMADEGGLIGYGPRFSQVYRQRARQIVKLLRGAKAADLPVEQPDKFELAVNLKTAKAIGHEVPASLVLRADTVIE